ncbi:hypothetical protein, partial [Thiolapillus sp.]|uniref:hypothetical protein n=1 Tax=Thiolapillus sp. TaxID=2017437 RepID=UPI003AF74A27
DAQYAWACIFSHTFAVYLVDLSCVSAVHRTTGYQSEPDRFEPTSQHGLDKYPPHVPTIYKNTHLASIEQTVYGPYQGFGRHPFSRVTDTRNQAGQQGQGHRPFLSPDHPGQADPALASYILRQIRLVAMLMMT